VIAPPVDPARQRHALARVFTPKFTAIVVLEHVYLLCRRSDFCSSLVRA
jgi:hypothetical protein